MGKIVKMRGWAVTALLLSVLFGFLLLPKLTKAQNLSNAGQWQLTACSIAECHVNSVANPAATVPDLFVNYHKYAYRYMDGPGWTATYTPPAPLDLSQATRFTCFFQTDAPNGWYSGQWVLQMVDKNGVSAEYMISKEAWRARTPTFVEQALTAFPPNFDRAAVSKVAVLGNVSVPIQIASVNISRLTFDSQPVGEADARRQAVWQKNQADAGTAQSFSLHVLPGAEKLYRDDWQASWAATKTPFPVQMHVARGGQDDCQVAILPSKNAGPSLKVRVTRLVGPGGAVIAPGQVTLFEMLWVPSLPKGRSDIYEGWYPDILKPLTNAALPLHRQYLSDLWVDVQAPRSVIPGRYQGRLTLTQGKTVRVVPLTLTVHQFTLPTRPTFRTAFWLFPENYAHSYGITPQSLKFSDYQPYAALALAHEITPISTDYVNFKVTPQPNGQYTVDLTPWKQFYSYTMQHGGNAVDLGYSDWFGARLLYGDPQAHFPGETPADRQKPPLPIPTPRLQILKTYLSEGHAFLKQHGWDQFSYLQLYDEAASQTDRLSVAYPAVKSVSPDTLILQTQMPEPSYAQWVDLTVPTIPAVDAPAAPTAYATEVRASGKHPWFYSCVNYGITIPEVAVRDRLIPWVGFASQTEGYLFWSLNRYSQPEPNFPARPWDEYRTNYGVSATMGDGTLMYPGATLHSAPLPSLRLKSFRDGMEDYEFLTALSRLYAQKKDQLSPDQQRSIQTILDATTLVASAWDHPDLPAQRRAEAGQWIDRLAKK